MQDGKPNPFLGLKPYGQKDRQKLYGRDKDLVLMKDRIFSARTTLLFAGSGVGKTSFLNAKIVPDLKRQYCVVYHNQWATDEPLVALSKSLATHFALNDTSRTPLPEPSTSKPLLEQLDRFRKGSTEISTGGLSSRCLLILDQFEEIFQYHAYEEYFAKFINELSTVINTPECNVRVLFSMREEFLGELSVFDNNIPDLFNNYYRLKCPNKVEAEEIIERTCSFAGTETNPTGLKTLVSDLARIEKGEPVVAEPSNGNRSSETFVQRDIVAPPYLQIACQRLWNVRYPSKDGNADKPAVEHDKQATANGQFLSDYQTGFARTMLRQFCREKFLSLSFRERALLADAFDFLVTKNGAKIAYELDSLASHMQVHQNILKSVLLKLSRSDSRILRMSKGPDGSLWFELYHDMYGSIVDEWKRSYRMERRAALQRNLMLAGMLLGIILVIAGAIVSFHHWYSEPQHYQKLLATADLQDPNKYPENLSAYIKLRETLGYRSRARKLWAEAWERRAHQAERQENESESFLFWLTAASEAPPKERAQSLAEVSNYLDSGDFKSLQATIRFEGAFSAIGINPPIFSDNGQALLKITSDLRIWKWNTNSGVLLTTSPPLQLDDQRSPRRPDSGPEVTTQSREPFIRAAAGNFVGGFDSNKFYVWTIDKGTIVWSAWRTGQPAASAPTAQPVTGGKKVFYGGGNYGTRTVEPSVAFSPDGQYFATVDDAGSTQTYTLGNKQDFKPLQSILSVAKLAFSPDNKTLGLLLRNQTLQLRNLKSAAIVTIDLTRNFRDISFSPDGTKLILQSEGFDRAEIRESPTGRLLTETDEINENLPLHFLADNKTIASTRLMSFSGGSTLNIKYLRTELAGESADRFILFENFNGSYFNPNGQSILTTSESGVARLWDAAPQQSGSKVIRESGFSNTILSGNGRVLAVLNNNGEVKFFNADDRSQLGTTLALNTAKPHPTVFTGPYDREYFPLLTVSNDGRFICIRQRGTSSAILWDTSGKRAVPVLTSGKHAFGPAAFSANSEMFGVAAPDLTVQIWKNLGAESPELLTWKQSDPVNALYFSPTGKYVAAICARTNKGGAYDRLVKVFDVAANREISLNTSLGDLVGVLRVSDNGKLVVGFGGERASQPVLYDLNTGTSSKLTHPAALTGVALSGSGTYLVTGCADGTVRLWDTNTGNLIGSPEKFGAIIRSVKISGDDKTVLAFSDQWIHASLITPEGLKYRSGQFTNSLYSGVSILNPEGTLFRHLLFTSQDTIGISDFSLNSVGNIPTTAPEILLDSWTQKLGVTLDDHGQVGARSNPSPSP